MHQMLNLPLYTGSMEGYSGWKELGAELQKYGCDGIEGIWGGEEIPEEFPAEMVIGYHLMFYPDWLDFYREKKDVLIGKFGNPDMVRMFFGGLGKDVLIEQYRADLQRAKKLGASYVVFHVSDVSIEESYTYRWFHSNREVIEASAELINTILEGDDWPFAFLVENQWWPGFTFTDPEETRILLDGIRYKNKGILLDTGHLMNTCPQLRTQSEGASYIHAMLDRHGSLTESIRGVHLHYSLSGDYVQKNTGPEALPNLPADYMERYGVNYGHILKIDQHLPWTDSSVRSVIERIQPEYLTHELTGGNRMERLKMLEQQMKILMG